jgi:excisionase family DNA binding protein
MSATLLLTVDQVAAELVCCTKTVRKLIATGELPAFRHGRLVRVRRSDLDRFILARVQIPDAACEDGARLAGVVVKGHLWE